MVKKRTVKKRTVKKWTVKKQTVKKQTVKKWTVKKRTVKKQTAKKRTWSRNEWPRKERSRNERSRNEWPRNTQSNLDEYFKSLTIQQYYLCLSPFTHLKQKINFIFSHCFFFFYRVLKSLTWVHNDYLEFWIHQTCWQEVLKAEYASLLWCLFWVFWLGWKNL